MDYSLFLNYDVNQDLNINDKYLGSLCDHVFADIMYVPDWELTGGEDYNCESTKIGILRWVYYNQALAMASGLNMNNIPFLTFLINKKALMELDNTRINQETIDELGAASNPNIVIIQHIGISAAWRNKGIAEKALKGFIKNMKGKCGYIIVLNCAPPQYGNDIGPDSLYEKNGVELAGLTTDREKAQWKLYAFFQRCGFRLFKNYDQVLVCNVDQVVPEHRAAAI